MKSRPILFTAPMVRAILDGGKTQTRRIVKHAHLNGSQSPADVLDLLGPQLLAEAARYCPYGQPGDQLWVRETFGHRASVPYKSITADQLSWLAYPDHAGFRADHPDEKGWCWFPSIHMPRWMSRITLEITGVRCERLNQITREDAIAEGCTGEHDEDGNMTLCAYVQYLLLWESINGRGSWELNPWVWCIEFRKVEA